MKKRIPNSLWVVMFNEDGNPFVGIWKVCVNRQEARNYVKSSPEHLKAKFKICQYIYWDC
jgi:hypothetical protein